MNAALLFPESSINNDKDIIQVKEDSNIEGIVIYPVNLQEVSQKVSMNSKTIEDIIPIYDFDCNLLWPNLSLEQV